MERRTAVVAASTLAAGALAVWLLRRRIRHVRPAPAPAATSFEAFLKRPAGNPSTTPIDPTSFEAYLRTPAAPAAIEPAPASVPGIAPPGTRPVAVLYGTEFGFSREVAEKLCAALAASGPVHPQLIDLAAHPRGLPLQRCQAVLVVCSTQGDGVPPSAARPFCDWLGGDAAPALGGLPFSVAALGDASYTHFARCGRRLDARLAALGGVRLAPRVDVNKEDWVAVDAWIAAAVAGVRALPLRTAAELGWDAPSAASAAAGAAGRQWGKSRPYSASVVAVEGLCRVESAGDKNTVRVELDLGGSGLEYLPGDALGVWPTNPPEAVAELLEALGADSALPVPAPREHYEDGGEAGGAKKTMPLREALSRAYDLRRPRRDLLALLLSMRKEAAAAGGAARPGRLKEGLNGRAPRSISLCADGSTSGGANASSPCAELPELPALVSNPAAAERYLELRHVVDVLRDWGAPPSPAELLRTLRPLAPRLYSISSSPMEAPRRVAITVAVVRYRSLGQLRLGVCSTQLGERVRAGQRLPVFVSRNPDFRLPPSLATPLIMVGPGTGLAPFRAFIQHRLLESERAGASPGRAALFFGCRRRDKDYLYGRQLEAWAAAGAIDLFTAFSREPGEKKVYVQARLREQAALVWALLQAGGHFYVCGDAAAMAGSVEVVLLEIIAQRLLGADVGCAEAEDAALAGRARAYLDELAAAGRYQRDVWY